MNVLHTVAGLWTTTGGPAASVPGLCVALADRGHSVTLLTGAGELAPEVAAAGERVELRTVPLGPYAVANFSLAFRAACREEASRCDLVHTHGVWLHPNWASAAAARSLGRPLVISPRGMLESWSLRRSKWRKRLLWRLVEHRSFSDAALVHVTSPGEAESVRRLGVGAPIAVVPNGVDLAGEYAAERIENLSRGARPSSESARTVLFLGRIHPKKGLDLLCDAWAALEAPGARLVICGGGERHHVGWLESRLASMASEGIDYLGPVSGERKLELLTCARVVILPSRSENYGMVIAEALACRTPVIASTETPWPALVERRCGWWIEPRVDAIRRALEEALELGEAARREMGERGRRLIEDEHSLARAAEKMEGAYRWITGAGDRPDWIH